MTEFNIDQVHFDDNGLIPAVVQEADTGAVLMLAYMNRESIAKTLERGETYFWSRSRKALWHKGETSGNTQVVKKISIDCDGDTLLVQVEQHGHACHTGEHSCFFKPVSGSDARTLNFGEVINSLSRVIRQRQIEQPPDSYTTFLFQSGIDKILKKVGEESAESIIAAKNHNPKEIAWEVSDLLYHLLVMLAVEHVDLADISAELAERATKKQTKGNPK